MSSSATIATPAGKTTGTTFPFAGHLDPLAEPQAAPTIFVVDDDINIRHSLETLIVSQGWQFQRCGSAQQFLAQPRALVPCALILTFSSTSSNDLEIQKRIARDHLETPIIVVADYEDIPTAVQAIKAGAVDFLMKPIAEDLLLAAIRLSLMRSRAALNKWKEMDDLRKCHASLSPREKQVMALVVSGRLNKQVGGELGISEITIKAHRGQVMQKMRAASFAHLVSMALKLRIASSTTPGVVSAP